MSLQLIFHMLEVDGNTFQENILGIVVETGSERIETEHVLAGLIRLPDGFARKRIIRQKIETENVIEVLKSSVENTQSMLPAISSLVDAPLSPKMEDVIQKLSDWTSTEGEKIVKERAFLGLLAAALNEETIEALTEYAFLNWETFLEGLCWPPIQTENTVELWDEKSSELLADSALDKSGRRLVGALEAEIVGLGLRKYTIEALFIALLSIRPSILEEAIRTHIAGSDAYVGSANDLVLELRNRISRPRNIKEAPKILKSTCDDRLTAVFENAVDIARDDRKNRISVRDITEAFVRKEMKGGFGNQIKAFGIDLEKISYFIESYTEEKEAEDDNALTPLDKLEERFEEMIIGQNHAIERILPLIKRLRFGYRRPGKPAGVFMFMGPSGTGKTQMAKALAEILYGSVDNLVMLEMGQFGTKESKSMFIGASPGYVGYGEGKLTNALRDNPESVILFDEVEKAHPLVFDVLLRFLDEGKIDDPAGPVRDGSKCLIVLTSNFLADELSKYEEKMESTDKKSQEEFYRDLRNELLNQGKTGDDVKIQRFFRPEFIFRIDEIVLFRSFDYEDYVKIAEISLNNEVKYVNENFDYLVSYDKEILEKIADESVVRKNEGARVVNRLVNVLVVNPIIDYLASHPNNELSSLHLSISEDFEEIKVEGKS